jgi:hypothetical protein
LYEKDQWQVGFRLVITVSDWPLLTGGRCSEVVVRTGLTVYHKLFSCLTADTAEKVDCSDFPSTGTDQVMTLAINIHKVKTLCKSDGWTVIQSRGNFSTYPKDYFSNKTFKEYQAGFGTPGVKSDFFILSFLDLSVCMDRVQFERLSLKLSYSDRLY